MSKQTAHKLCHHRTALMQQNHPQIETKTPYYQVRRDPRSLRTDADYSRQFFVLLGGVYPSIYYMADN
ncbi:hypothetical protein [Vibrio vulnificus YJ016]|uniref:Uncharacterized protein n=1 Tax=Vibrio vulnificus (strain YJ016) TaxID=196600 RepID=Q7ME50_VIBVY|nr:hypothetical protein [Vibrio vulnificus YJ016]